MDVPDTFRPLDVPVPPGLPACIGYHGPMDEIGLVGDHAIPTFDIHDGCAQARGDADALRAWMGHPAVRLPDRLRADSAAWSDVDYGLLLQGTACRLWLAPRGELLLYLRERAELAADAEGTLEAAGELEAELRRWGRLWTHPASGLAVTWRARRESRLTQMRLWLEEQEVPHAKA